MTLGTQGQRCQIENVGNVYVSKNNISMSSIYNYNRIAERNVVWKGNDIIHLFLIHDGGIYSRL